MQISVSVLVKRYCSLRVIGSVGIGLTLSFLLTACWAPAIKPSMAEIDKHQTLLIVPVESPPLEVIPDLLEQRDPAYRHFQNMSLAFPLQNGVYQTTGGIVVAGLLGEGQKTDAIMMDKLSSGGMPVKTEAVWTPATAAALKARDLIEAENLKGVLSQEAYRLPMASRTGDLRRWREATEVWYGLDQTPVDYGRQGRFDAVMEIGIGSYRVFEGQTSLQLLIKLVDPVTRKVVARTRADSFRVDDEALASVDRGGEQFKQLIADMSVPLLRQGLGDIGLHGSADWLD